MTQIQVINCLCGNTFAGCHVPECYQTSDWLISLKNYSEAGCEIKIMPLTEFKFSDCTCKEKPVFAETKVDSLVGYFEHLSYKEQEDFKSRQNLIDEEDYECDCEDFEDNEDINYPKIITLEDQLKMDSITKGFNEKSLIEIDAFFNS